MLYAEVYGNKLNFGGIKYQYKLDVDRNQKKVYLSVYNRYNTLIEQKVYWSFDYLKSRLLTKLEYIAIVAAWPWTINNCDYFKYYKIDIYKLISFDNFINLIEDGTIKLSIKVDIYTSDKHYGKTYDHGCGFAIQEQNLTKLYNNIYKN